MLKDIFAWRGPINVFFIQNEVFYQLVDHNCYGIIIPTALEKVLLVVFLFFHKNICYVFSLEAPPLGASNEYPQQVFVEK